MTQFSTTYSMSRGLTINRGWSPITYQAKKPPQAKGLGEVCWVSGKYNCGNEAFLGVVTRDPAFVNGIPDGHVFSKYWPVLYRGPKGTNPPLFVAFSSGGRVWVYVDARARCQDPREMCRDEAVEASLRAQAVARKTPGYRCSVYVDMVPRHDEIASAHRTLQQVTKSLIKSTRAYLKETITLERELECMW